MIYKHFVFALEVRKLRGEKNKSKTFFINNFLPTHNLHKLLMEVYKKASILWDEYWAKTDAIKYRFIFKNNC